MAVFVKAGSIRRLNHNEAMQFRRILEQRHGGLWGWTITYDEVEYFHAAWPPTAEEEANAMLFANGCHCAMCVPQGVIKA